MNKQDALKKLNAILKQMDMNSKDKQKNDAWREHTKIIRGNPVRMYEGMEFTRKITAKQQNQTDRCGNDRNIV